MLQNKLTEFFESNPEATTVFVALGKLFTEFEAAQKYLGGVHGHTVQTVSRQQVIKTEEPGLTESNSGDSGTTDQQSIDNNISTDGTGANAPLSDKPKNETDQITEAGVISDAMTDEHKEKVNAKSNEVYELTVAVQKLTEDKAHHATIKSAQKKLDVAKAELAELCSGKQATV